MTCTVTTVTLTELEAAETFINLGFLYTSKKGGMVCKMSIKQQALVLKCHKAIHNKIQFN